MGIKQKYPIPLVTKRSLNKKLKRQDKFLGEKNRGPEGIKTFLGNEGKTKLGLVKN